MTDDSANDGTGDGQAAVVAFLADPATHGGAAVERIATHASLVFLAGDRAYKVKRAVKYPYLDFSTLEKRRRACIAEIAINRRTAPSLYLGIAPVLRSGDGGLRLGPVEAAPTEGAAAPECVVEWLVVMRRFDQDTLFDRLGGEGALTDGLMRRLAEAVAAFHDRAEVRPQAQGAHAMRAVIDGNVEEMAAWPKTFAPDKLDRLATLSRDALAAVSGLLDQRARDGWVRLCHGDLHLRNICLVDGEPTLFDAIEFNETIAVVDVLYDLAFLLMDLGYRGLRRLANVVLNRYLEAAWARDPAAGDATARGLAALPLFLATRAAVRAKVQATAADKMDGAKAAAARREAARYLDLALDFLEPAAPRLLVVAGLSGTGKTTLARALAPELAAAPGAVVLRSDVTRKQLAGVAEDAALPASAYSKEMSARVYDTLLDRARLLLKAGRGVITDAVFAREQERAAVEQLALDAGARFDGLWLEAPEEVLVARVDARHGDASDADAGVVRRQLGYDLGRITWPRVDASGSPAQVSARARDILAGR